MKRNGIVGAGALALAMLISSAAILRGQDKPSEPPPGLAALNDALKTVDVAKRFEALQKVIADYPNGDVAKAARSQLTSQFTGSLKAGASAAAFVAGEIEKSKNLSDYAQFAQNLLDAGVFLDEAERVAVKGLAIDEQAYVAAMKDTASAAKPPTIVRTIRDGVSYYAEAIVIGRAPAKPDETSEADLRGDFKSAHARLLAILGQIYAQRFTTNDGAKTTGEAEQILKQAWAADLPNPSKRAVARALAELAARAGDTQGELDYRASAYVLGGASPSARETLETIYRRRHGGSIDGLDDVLDAAYRRAIKPIEVKAYERPKTPRSRVVLAELFTGAGCPPCVGVDMAFDAALERFSRGDLAVLVYHQHVPAPDPMTNPATEARASEYDLDGVPTFAIDGRSTSGGGPASEAQDIFDKDIRPAIEKRMAAAPEARLDLTASREGSIVRVHARVGDVKRRSRALRLQIALVEDLQRYSGPNGVRLHPMVVRSLAGKDFKGFAVPSRGTSVDWTFDLAAIVAENTKAIDEHLAKASAKGDKRTFGDGRRDAIDASRLTVVAFVQDDDPAQDKAAKPAKNDEPPSRTRIVLQAASVKVEMPKGS